MACEPIYSNRRYVKVGRWLAKVVLCRIAGTHDYKEHRGPEGQGGGKCRRCGQTWEFWG